MKTTFVIAEGGVNHNGDVNLAFELVDAALDAEADAVKFQVAIPELVVTRSAAKANYQTRTTPAGESQLDMIRKLLLPFEGYRKVVEHGASRGITVFSTAFDLVSLGYLEELGQDIHKIPSGEITNLPYLKQIGGYGKPIVLSTGMSNLGEVEAALEILENAGTPRDRITLLHCSTEYPAPMEEVNLRAMQTLGQAFDTAVGYSDHTQGIEVAIAAVALGATVIEKHLTLSCELEGPDHRASLEPADFKAMVAAIRNIEKALGSRVKRVGSVEMTNRSVARRSLVAGRPIAAGEEFTPSNVIAKRPGTGISPMRWDDVIGRRASRNYVEDEVLEI